MDKALDREAWQANERELARIAAMRGLVGLGLRLEVNRERFAAEPPARARLPLRL